MKKSNVCRLPDLYQEMVRSFYNYQCTAELMTVSSEVLRDYIFSINFSVTRNSSTLCEIITQCTFNPDS